MASAIAAKAHASGIELPPDAALRIARHLELLAEGNRSASLTSVPPSQYLTRHVLDSLAGLRFVDAAPAGRIADLGSGNGFPGVVLALATGRPVDLVESIERKARFLSRVVEDICLDATVRRTRAESLARDASGEYAVVVARALAELPAVVELASPLLMQGGLLVCYKGAPGTEERRRAAGVADKVGMRESRCEAVKVPGLDESRTIVVYEKLGAGSVPLPRREGQAQRRPLG